MCDAMLKWGAEGGMKLCEEVVRSVCFYEGRMSGLETAM